MRNIRLGSLLGIPVLVNPSWFLLLGFVTWILAAQVYPEQLSGRSPLLYFVMALVTVVMFFVSIVLHELGHSVVARAYSIPVKSITLFIFGGVAQITREARRPLNELLMAVAGPFVSLVLGAAFLGLWWALGAETHRPVDLVFLWLAFTNVLLAIFNMIPAFPMDGGRCFRAIVWLITRDQYRATEIAGWTGRGFAWVIMGTGALGLIGVETVLTRSPMQSLWFIFIGLFLETAARQNLVQNRAVRALDRYRARDLMITDPPVVDGTMPLTWLARGVIEINPRIAYFVEDRGKLAGILSAYQMRAIPEAAWDSTTAAQAMLPSAKLSPVPPDRPASEVLIEMENAELTHLPVVENGRVLGVVGRDGLLGILRQAGFLNSAKA